MENDNFIFNYDAKIAKEIAKIAEKYSRVLSDSYDEIKRLDKEAERPAKIWFTVLLIVGILTFGGGLSLAFVYNRYLISSLVGICGIFLFAYSFRLKKKILEKRRKEYGPKILALLEKEH